MTNEPADLELSQLLNHLRGTTSMDALAKAVDYRVSEQTLIRLGDYNRPFKNPVQPETLVNTAEAINRATSNHTTPWALWIAHGVQFERTAGLTGRPRGHDLDALPLLFPDWHRLSSGRLAAWNRAGAAFYAEQTAESDAGEVERLRAENASLRAQLAEATTTSTPAKDRKARS